MLRTGHKLLGVLLVAGASGMGCTALLGDFSNGKDAGPDASVGADANSSGGGGTHHDGGGLDSTVVPEAAGGEAGTDVIEIGDDGGTEAEAEASAACVSGARCFLGPCVSGISVCDGGVTSCTQNGTSFNGTGCDAGAVCSNGACIGCQVGSSCADAG